MQSSAALLASKAVVMRDCWATVSIMRLDVARMSDSHILTGQVLLRSPP